MNLILSQYVKDNMMEDNKESAKTHNEKAEKLSEKDSKDNSHKSPDKEDRNGILPEGMDFKKFIGCGG